MNSTALRAPSRLSLTALLFGLLLPFGALAEEAAPTAQAPVAATAANAQADTTQALPATPAQHPQAEALKASLDALGEQASAEQIEAARQAFLQQNGIAGADAEQLLAAVQALQAEVPAEDEVLHDLSPWACTRTPTAW